MKNKIKIMEMCCFCDDDYMLNKSFIEDSEFDNFMQVHRKKQIVKMFVTPNSSLTDRRVYIFNKKEK